MPEYDIRPATEAEMGQIGLITSYVYGGSFGDGEDNIPATSNRPEWTLCAFDGVKMAASYATIPFTMRANGRAMAMGGVSIVGTLPEYRRQGLLRRITERAFTEMRERGQTVAALWASQAAIYQRYGYSMCSVERRYELDTVDANLLVPADPAYKVTRSTLTQTYAEIKDVYRQFVTDRSLYLHRSAPLWQTNALADNEADGPVNIALCRDPEGIQCVVQRGSYQPARTGDQDAGREVGPICGRGFTCFCRHVLPWVPPAMSPPPLASRPRGRQGVWRNARVRRVFGVVRR